jgi:hypothetical protein
MIARTVACFLLVGCAVQQPEISAKISESEPAIRERIVPGTTLGNVPLQRQTLSQLKGPAIQQTISAECDLSTVFVVDTILIAEPKQSEYSLAFAVWKELWTFDVCGKPVGIEVTYMKHTSGSINVSSRLSEWSSPTSLLYQ